MSTRRNDLAAQTPAAAAAEWFVALQSADISNDTQEKFADWLRRSPVHVKEFLLYTALREDLSRLPDLAQLDTDALLREARDAPNVIGIDVGADAQIADKDNPVAGRPSRHRFAMRLAAAVALIAVGLGTLPLARNFLGTERYDTTIGEQRSLVLADGSQVQLNVESALTAKVNDAARDIRLNGGEALFQVASDPTRPFRVYTPQATIEALGTQFNVHVRDGQTIVALLDGRVAVRSVRDAAPVTLSPGEKVVVASQGPARPVAISADLDTVTAWTKRRLIFEDVPLAEVIAEFNRYSRQPLAIEDPALRDVRITASFDSGSTQAFAETLASASGLRVAHRADGGWLIER